MKIIPGLVLCVFLLLAAGIMLRLLDNSKSEDWDRTKLTYFPSGKYLKHIVLGYDHAVAGLLWVKGMTYFGEAYLEKKEYPWLSHIINIVITLNPQFEKAYEFGGTILSNNPETLKESVAIMEKGIHQFPENDRMRVLTAINRIDLDSNYLAAADYLKPVILNEHALPYMKGLAATLIEKGKSKEAALEFLMQSYLMSVSPINREFILEKIFDLYKEEKPASGQLEHLKKMIGGIADNPKRFFEIKSDISAFFNN